MRRIESDRRQHRHHFAEEIILDPRRLLGREIAAPQEPDAFGFERGKHLAVEQPVLVGDERVRFRRHVLEHALRPHLVRTDRRRARLDLGLHAGDADLEEFVEVAADDAEKLQPLEQRIVAVLRLREHAAGERELPELAVEIEVRRELAERGAATHGPAAEAGRARSDVRRAQASSSACCVGHVPSLYSSCRCIWRISRNGR